MIYPVVGAYFRPPAKAILQVLPLDCPLQLIPEPDNPYDPYAVKVIVQSTDIPEEQQETLDVLAAPFGFGIEEILAEPEWHLGYVPKTMAQALSAELQGEPRDAKLGFNSKGDPVVVIND